MKSLDEKNEALFITKFVQHQRSIQSFISTIVPRNVDAEEILQEASLTMWKKFDQFEEGTNFRNWAYQIAKFTAFNHVRRIKRQRLVFESSLVDLIAKDIQQNDAILDARKKALKYCVQKLSDKDSIVLEGCYTSNQSVNEYSADVGRTPNAIYKQLDRIRRDLYACIRQATGELANG